MKGWKLAILIIVTLFAVIYVLGRNINPLTEILIQVASYGLFIGLIFFFLYLAGRVYLKETRW